MVAKEVGHDFVKSLREESVVLKTEGQIERWEDAEIVLMKLLDLSYKPRIVILSRSRAMVDFTWSQYTSQFSVCHEIKVDYVL